MTTAQNEIKTNVDEMAATVDDKYEAMDKEINQIRSSVGSAKNGLTSQIRQINVSFIFDIFHFPFNMNYFFFLRFFRFESTFIVFILGKTR